MYKKELLQKNQPNRTHQWIKTKILLSNKQLILKIKFTKVKKHVIIAITDFTKVEISMIFSFSKELYPKYVLLKSAYNFTDRAYIHLDESEDYYIVNIDFKEDAVSFNPREFENEMLTQAVRYVVAERTKSIRKLVTARAMASTIINAEPEGEPDNVEDVDMDDILKDWFENEDC